MATTTKATLSLKDEWRRCPQCFEPGRKTGTAGNDGWPYKLRCEGCGLEAVITIHFRSTNESQMPVWSATR